MIEQILCFLVLIICLVYGLALLSWLVMKLDIEKRRSKRTKFFERIGGTLMEIEKLIEKLRTESLYKDKATLEIMDLCMDAALSLEQLQAENDRLRRERDAVVESIPRECKSCRYHTIFFNGCTLDHDCTNPDGYCSNNYDRWQWRGPKEEKKND